jgi:CRISPR-associated protein Cmr1
MPHASLQVEFVTPCFLGGADNATLAEWRVPSVRGQLRWWYRCIAGGHYGGDLTRTREGEVRLFGSTDRASPLRIRASSSPHSLQVRPVASPFGKRVNASTLAKAWRDERPEVVTRLSVRRAGTEVPSNPVEYLAFGAVVFDRDRHETVLAPAHIEAAKEAGLRLMWPASVVNADLRLLRAALWAWLNLGGIGAKSRRGFGSPVPVQRGSAGDDRRVRARNTGAVQGAGGCSADRL